MLSFQAGVVANLQAQLQVGVNASRVATVASGSRALDTAVGGGFRRGTIIEWLGDEGQGATTLAFALGRQSLEEGRSVVVLDPHGRFYPPAAAALGIDLRLVVVACPKTKQEQEWALNQALSCPAVAAAVCWPEKLDDRAFRRLQLSAEKGGAIGLIVRGASAAHEPSWADARLLVRSVGAATSATDRRRFRVEVLRSRGGDGRSVEVEISEEGLLHDADPLHSVSGLAAATPHQRASPA